MKSVAEMVEIEEIDEDFDLLAEVRARAEVEGWHSILKEALDILSDLSQQPHWHEAICVVYWAGPQAADAPIPKMAIVARLYWCLQRHDGFGGDALNSTENLVWTIATDLKGVRYESDWSPENDPEVARYLTEMNAA